MLRSALVSLRMFAEFMRAAFGLLTGRRVPLIVSWNVTYRCNLECVYCNTNTLRRSEYDTNSVLYLGFALRRLGATFIGFSGGEPLVREDFGTIVRAFSSSGMFVSLQTNGILLPKRIYELRGLREVRVSLDGPKEVQDQLRGKGTYDAAIEAIRVCKKLSVPVFVTAVLSSPSLHTLPEFVELLETLGVGALFQPIDKRFAPHLSPGDPIWPSPEAFIEGVDFLISAKRRGSRAILNSEAGLLYLRGWPDPKPLRCLASKIMCSVEPDGSLFICDMYPGYQGYLKFPQGDLGRLIANTKLPQPCPRCATAAMTDLNLAASGSKKAAFTIASRLCRLSHASSRK